MNSITCYPRLPIPTKMPQIGNWTTCNSQVGKCENEIKFVLGILRFPKHSVPHINSLQKLKRSISCRHASLLLCRFVRCVWFSKLSKDPKSKCTHEKLILCGKNWIPKQKKARRENDGQIWRMWGTARTHVNGTFPTYKTWGFSPLRLIPYLLLQYRSKNL